MIVAIPKGTLNAKQKELLTKKGFVVIECDDPEKIRVINPESTVGVNDMVLSALKALTASHPTSRQEHFVNELYKQLTDRES